MNFTILKSNRDGNFSISEFEKNLSAHGILHEMGPAEIPEQNLVVARFMRTIESQLRSQLIHRNLPIHL